MDETSAGPGAVRLVHDDDRDRYKAMDGSEVVGVLYYGDELTLAHATGTDAKGANATGTDTGTDTTRVLRDLRSTVVAPDRSGHGVGSALVRLALDDAREHGLRVRATCWFVRGWIQRHPEYADLLDTSVTDEGKEPR